MRGRPQEADHKTSAHSNYSRKQAKNKKINSPKSSQTTTEVVVQREEDLFPVVGIGASAGGLEALQDLFRALPHDTGLAFTIVQHLDPSRESGFPQILAKVTTMPVAEVKDGMRVEPNHVYIIPGNANMILSGGVLKLTPRTELLPHSLAIDPFLLSLANDRKELAIGVILSGSGSDGAHGITAIKVEGGITFAQDNSAKFDSMPEAAINTGCVDFVLPPKDIATELHRISRHPMMATSIEKPRIESPSGEEDEAQDPLFGILTFLRRSVGIDFTSYKLTTMRRRISRRMLFRKIEKLEDYLPYLRNNPSEVAALHQDLLIKVTSFFRDPEAFEALEKEILPRLMKHRSPGVAIRVWVAGCSTGEEVYSIAMCLLELLGDTRKHCSIQIFGTDVSEQAIRTARSGIYPENVMTGISTERRRRFFTPVENGSQISTTVREMCVFAKHDVTEDPPFSNLDLLSCRNLLIYLVPRLQKRVLSLFHYALTPTGFLVLGNSESIGYAAALFSTVDTQHKIFSKKLVPGEIYLGFTKGQRNDFQTETRQLTSKQAEYGPKGELATETDRALASRFAPNGVVINEDMEILHLRGHTGTYLEPSPGEISNNVLKMVRAEMRAELRSAIHKAKQENRPVRKEGIRINSDGGPFTVCLEVIPISVAASNERYFAVSFSKATAQSPPIPPQKTGRKQKHETSSRIADLEKELATTHEYLQSLIEKEQTANEELRAANEEITSSNEELQSTNEELETAQEELQSVNEELSTVNDELQNRNTQLNSLNNDLNNLIASVSIPVLIVGHDLSIRRFTPAATKVMKIIPTDVGRPLGDIKTNIDIPDLVPLLISVMDNVRVEEREVRDAAGHWFSMAIRPYKTIENKVDGAVITLFDINAIHRAMDDLIKINVELEQFAYVASHDLQEPLRMVSTYLDLLSKRYSNKLDKDADEFIQIALKSARLMKALVADLLAFSRTGREDLKYENTDCSLLVDKTIASLQPDLDKTNGEITRDSLPTIDASRILIGQVFQNLINNAVKFRGDKAPRVHISGQEKRTEWEFSVRDNGIGIEKQYADRIFLIFQRLHDPEKYPGTGIGLAICKRIVERYGGHIWVESKPGEGTTFSFTIPKRQMVERGRASEPDYHSFGRG